MITFSYCSTEAIYFRMSVQHYHNNGSISEDLLALYLLALHTDGPHNTVRGEEPPIRLLVLDNKVCRKHREIIYMEKIPGTYPTVFLNSCPCLLSANPTVTV